MTPIGGLPQVEEINARGVEPVSIPDPGNAGSIDVSHSGYVELVTTGAETRTLPDPTFKGQIIDFTFADIGDHQRLVGFWNSTDGWEWREIANDGAGLSTV